jgi:hypothetical protein
MTVKTSLGNITASEAVLNEISLAFYQSGERDEANGLESIATERKNIADEIYNALNESGYYNFY